MLSPAATLRGRYLDCGKTYKIHLPPNIPAKNFWSLVVYDNQTRSMLQTDAQFPSIGSQTQASSSTSTRRSMSGSARARRRP
jgi:hypothetical protein